MKKQLIMIMSLIALIPLLVYGTFSLITTSNKIEKDAYSMNEQNVNLVLQKTTALINSEFEMLQQLSENPEIKEYTPTQLAKVKNLLVSVGKLHPEIQSIIFTATDGEQIAKSSDGDLSNTSDRDYFKQLIATQKQVVSDILVSKSTGKKIVTVVYPVFDTNNTLSGMVQVTLPLDSMSTYAKEFSTNGQTAYIADRTGTILAHPDPNSLDKDIKDTPSFQNASQGTPGTLTYGEKSDRVLVSYCQRSFNGMEHI
ncbi:hypothetical protein QE450_000803 [Paenibacillus sp. SORGH_AS306]|uniref:PDC sensor domain-containing protein n=1 Tax=Paenibacillus sp. SORGH_AS_0306 TaxID=3041754 RepID=UPI00277F54BA|nr:cache domain-containing protein [Paenibacillus sp. SORGH_AS_0306]MDQ1233305.1 hypothetical protein [Paenibacillus sp. SORGH_AS_0306]